MSGNLILIIAILAAFYFWYTIIISRRNKALEALAGVDVQLQNRLELIPNILTIAKKFMEHEEKIFTEVTKLREQLSQNYDSKNPEELKKHLELAAELSQKMNNFMVRAENYPELKSSQNMLQAQQSYNEVEAQIAASRRFYNSAVASLRNSIQIFPGNIIAAIAQVKTMPLYEATEAAKKPVDAKNFL